MSTSQTILVQKKDGTKVRMTMDEFLVYKQSLTEGTKDDKPGVEDHTSQVQDATVAPVISSVDSLAPSSTTPSVPDNLPVAPTTEPEDMVSVVPKEESHILPQVVIPATETTLATTTPVKRVFVDEAIAAIPKKSAPDSMPKQWSKEDHESLLSEETPSIGGLHRVSGGDDSTPLVLALSFKISPDLHGRLASLATSYSKGVRTSDQVAEYARRDVASGGLGLSAEEGHELLRAMEKMYGKKESHIPARREMPRAGSVSPSPEQKEKKEDTSMQKNEALSSSVLGARPSLRDVTAPVASVAPMTPKVASAGPVEEIRSLDVVDLRRLAATQAEVQKIIEEKFQHLHRESIDLFLKGRRAWYESPLFRAYQDILFSSLATQTPVTSLLGGGDATMSKDEFETVLHLSTLLGV